MRASLSALLALVCAFVAGSAVSAANAPPLGVTAFGSMVVDDAHGHVFVSGPKENEVLVFDFRGVPVKTIPNIPGAAAVVVAGSSLYVVAGTTGAIERIDLGTLADTGPVVTGLSTPRSLAFAGGKLWTGVNGNGQWTQLASVGLDGAVNVFSTPTYYNPDFATTPSDPNELYLAQDGLSPGSVYRLDVSSGSPVVIASNTATDQSNIRQLAVSPDGTRVIPASGYPYNFEELGPSTLRADGVVYPAQPYPSAVAVSPGSGGLLATGVKDGYSAPDISVFRLGDPQAIFSTQSNRSDGTANVMPHGLALTADGSRLFAVTADTVYENAFHLWSFPLPPSKTTMTASPAQLVKAKGGTQTASLRATLTAYGAPVAGRTVAFTSAGTPLCSATTSSAGIAGCIASVRSTVDARALVKNSYTASFGGDNQYLPSSASATVSG